MPLRCNRYGESTSPAKGPAVRTFWKILPLPMALGLLWIVQRPVALREQARRQRAAEEGPKGVSDSRAHSALTMGVQRAVAPARLNRGRAPRSPTRDDGPARALREHPLDRASRTTS